MKQKCQRFLYIPQFVEQEHIYMFLGKTTVHYDTV